MMNNWLIFQYHRESFDEAVTQKDSQTAKMENCGQIMKLIRSEVRVLIRLGYDVE